MVVKLVSTGCGTVTSDRASGYAVGSIPTLAGRDRARSPRLIVEIARPRRPRPRGTTL